MQKHKLIAFIKKHYLKLLITWLVLLTANSSLAQEITYNPKEQVRPANYPENHVYDSVEKSAEYPGGIDKFRECVVNNFDLPEELEESLRFTVSFTVTFIVEKDGSLTDIKLSKNPGFGISEQIQTIFDSSKKWKPGYENGKPVRTHFQFPIALQFE